MAPTYSLPTDAVKDGELVTEVFVSTARKQLEITTYIPLTAIRNSGLDFENFRDLMTEGGVLKGNEPQKKGEVLLQDAVAEGAGPILELVEQVETKCIAMKRDLSITWPEHNNKRKVDDTDWTKDLTVDTDNGAPTTEPTLDQWNYPLRTSTTWIKCSGNIQTQIDSMVKACKTRGAHRRDYTTRTFSRRDELVKLATVILVDICGHFHVGKKELRA